MSACIGIMERHLYLAYDPLKSPDYKVIYVWRFAGDLLYKILIYSSETRVWRLSKSDEYFYYSSKAHFDRGAYWNGAVHWHCDTDNWLYFNIDKEKLNIMPPPVKLEDGLLKRPFVYFGESGGHLHVVEDYSQAVALYIYEMEIDYSGWYKKREVRLDAIPAALPETTKLRYPTEEGITLLSVICRESDEDWFLVLQVHGCIVQYSLGCEASWVQVHFDFDHNVYGGGLRSWGWYDAFQYTLSCFSHFILCS